MLIGWDTVLSTLSTLRLPAPKLYDLFEHLTLELLETRQIDTARSLLRTTPALQTMKNDHPERYLKLEHLVARSYFDANTAYGGMTKEKRRQSIAQGTTSHIA